MSKAHSHHHARRHIDPAWLLLALILVCSSAYALKSDRTQLIHVFADQQQASLRGNRTVTLTGHVKIKQGSLVIQGSSAKGYENQSNAWDRAVIKGSPAQFRQKLDGGGSVHGSATTITYVVAKSEVILVGNAKVVQEGRGTFTGAKLTYDTDSGRITGKGGKGGQVQMTFKPNSTPGKPATATKPAPPARQSTVPGPGQR